MYTGTNVQPQMNNTGHGGSNNGESKEQARSFSPNELPAPAAPSVNSEPVGPAVPQNPVPLVPATSDNHWVQEVEQLFDRTAQNPHQRGEEFSELRRRYQQDVLGIKHVGRDDSV